MTIDAISAVGLHDEVAPLARPAAAAAAPSVSFAGQVAEGLQEINTQLLTSQRDLQQLAVGQVENLHEVLIRLEESRTALQFLLQVRNRVLEAYQDVMRMQV